MSYGRNFGFRSFENIIRDARFRAPSGGSPLRIGEGVMVDVATPGRIKQATNGVVPTQLCGIAVFEHIQNKSDALVTNHDDPYDKVPLGQYVQLVHGIGVKVWLKNTALTTLYDGRQRAAVNWVAAGDLSGLAVGEGLSPDGSGGWAEDASSPWLTVEQIDTELGLVEARFNF